MVLDGKFHGISGTVASLSGMRVEKNRSAQERASFREVIRVVEVK